MSATQQKIVVQRPPTRDNFATDDREYLINFRRSLLQMLAVIEKKLGITRGKCRRCGHVLSD